MADWISEIKTEQDRSVVEQEARNNQAFLEAAILDSKGPQFWASMVSHLTAMVGRLDEIELRATISETSTSIENTYKIAVSTANGLYPRQVHTDVFYKNGSKAIRCVPLDVTPYKLFFEINNGALMVVASDSHNPMTPEDAATRILRPMVSRLHR